MKDDYIKIEVHFFADTFWKPIIMFIPPEWEQMIDLDKRKNITRTVVDWLNKGTIKSTRKDGKWVEPTFWSLNGGVAPGQVDLITGKRI